MRRRLLLSIAVLSLVATLACGFVGSAVLVHGAIPALARWEAPYGMEGREPPAESVSIDSILPGSIGEYDLSEVVLPAPPVRLDDPVLSVQGNYTEGAQVVHLIVIKMDSLDEVHGLVAQVDEEVLGAGARGLEGYWWPFQGWPDRAWKMSRLAWDKRFVRFHIPAWGDQACGVAWNNGPWFFMATDSSLSTMRDLVTGFDY